MKFVAWYNLSNEYRSKVEGHSPWKKDETNPQPLLIENVETDIRVKDYIDIFINEGIRSLGFFPLVSGKRLIGKFMVYFDNPHEFTDTDILQPEFSLIFLAMQLLRKVNK